MKNSSLTNEDLRKKFSDSFQMTNFAILVARDYVKQNEGGSLIEILKEIKEKAQQQAT